MRMVNTGYVLFVVFLLYFSSGVGLRLRGALTNDRAVYIVYIVSVYVLLQCQWCAPRFHALVCMSLCISVRGGGVSHSCTPLVITRPQPSD